MLKYIELYMTKDTALWVIGSGLIFIILGILILAYIAGSLKPIYALAILGILVTIYTLYKEINSSENNQSIKNTGENTNLEVKSLRIENEELRIKTSTSLELIKAQRQGLDLLQNQNAMLSAQGNEIHKETKEVYAQTQGIQTQTASIKSTISGDGSFCYVDIDMSTMFKSASVSVRHIGKHTLKNVQISIICTDTYIDRNYLQSGKFDPSGKNGMFKYGYMGNPYKETLQVLSPGEFVSLPQLEDVVFNTQKSFNICIRADNGLILYQRMLSRQQKAFHNELDLPRNPELNENYLSVSQLYMVRKLTPEEEWKSIQANQDKSFSFPRAEIIVREGANHLLGNDIAKGQADLRIEYIRWRRDFPLLDKESLPFTGVNKMHWNGHKNSGPDTNFLVIAEYYTEANL